MLTLHDPFAKDFDASEADELEMLIEEVEMPGAVQKIGNLQVKTWDDREGKVRAIDVLNLDKLETVSGAIRKLSEVEVDDVTTSTPDRTYYFHYELTHAVPAGGAFGFLLSEDTANGVTLSEGAPSCYYMDGGRSGSERLLTCERGVTEEGRAFVKIICDATTFGIKGTPKGVQLMFKITGLTNPRLAGYKSYFKLYTMDK
jgi:hypothetical protein